MTRKPTATPTPDAVARGIAVLLESEDDVRRSPFQLRTRVLRREAFALFRELIRAEEKDELPERHREMLEAAWAVLSDDTIGVPALLARAAHAELAESLSQSPPTEAGHG